MSADDPAQSLSSLERYLILDLILAAVVLSSSLYSTALLTTSTILPQMQGAMSATQDEIAAAMTFNILATDPAQHVSAPSTPLVLSMFGMAVGVAPVAGPVLGGYLAEAYTWRWAFHMLVPVGVLAYLGLRLAQPADTRPRRIELDGRDFWRWRGAWRCCNWSSPAGFALIGSTRLRSCSSACWRHRNRDDFPLQYRAGPALGRRGLGFGEPAGPCQDRQGSHPPSCHAISTAS